MSDKLESSLGYVTEEVDDQLQCLALEFGMSREDLVGTVVGIGITVLEASKEVNGARVTVWDGESQGRRIALPQRVTGENNL
jgi:hypothetical protein